MAVPLVDSCIGVISVSLCSGTFGFARLRSRFSFSADTISVVRYGSGLGVCVRGGEGGGDSCLGGGRDFAQFGRVHFERQRSHRRRATQLCAEKLLDPIRPVVER